MCKALFQSYWEILEGELGEGRNGDIIIRTFSKQLVFSRPLLASQVHWDGLLFFSENIFIFLV